MMRCITKLPTTMAAAANASNVSHEIDTTAIKQASKQGTSSSCAGSFSTETSVTSGRGMTEQLMALEIFVECLYGDTCHAPEDSVSPAQVRPERGKAPPRPLPRFPTSLSCLAV